MLTLRFSNIFRSWHSSNSRCRMSLRAWRQNPVAHHLFTLDQHIPGVDSETVSSKKRGGCRADVLAVSGTSIMPVGRCSIWMSSRGRCQQTARSRLAASASSERCGDEITRRLSSIGRTRTMFAFDEHSPHTPLIPPARAASILAAIPPHSAGNRLELGTCLRNGSGTERQLGQSAWGTAAGRDTSPAYHPLRCADERWRRRFAEGAHPRRPWRGRCVASVLPISRRAGLAPCFASPATLPAPLEL